MSIPKIIHYCWVGGNPKPESVIYCINSWKKYCPDYEIKEWNESNYDFSQNQYMNEAYEAKKWGFVPDYARLDIIYKYGGIYLDTDVEVIKNLDDLLSNKAFVGFEKTDTSEWFVNCGQGFGAEPKNPSIKFLRDFYDGKSFYNGDGSLNLLPSPHYTTEALVSLGMKCENIKQKLESITIYTSDVLCPKSMATGKIEKTKNTYSIHHFTASWMDEAIVKSMQHNQQVCLKYGNRIGHWILLAESVYEKYGILGALKRPLIKCYEYLYDIAPIFKGRIKSHFKSNKNLDEVMLFDTAKGTKNAGDCIIMENCELQLSEVLNLDNAQHISTHNGNVENIDKDAKHKIVCGTNILSCKMKNYGLWKLPRNLDKYSNIILMGVGFDSYNKDSDFYTRYLLKYMLSKKGYHSVRDSFSEECLKNMGINNVLYTGCPTMWRLTPEHCDRIPQRKSNKVVCTLTDYNRSEEEDKKMLSILLDLYDEVYFWLQGSEDLNYVKSLGFDHSVRLIPSNLNDYDEILKMDDLDYVGTRLHAGIRALSFGHRSIIISIDNRAECISKDTGLPVLKRTEVLDYLENKILNDFKTEITLPEKNVKLWLSQFK